LGEEIFDFELWLILCLDVGLFLQLLCRLLEAHGEEGLVEDVNDFGSILGVAEQLLN